MLSSSVVLLMAVVILSGKKQSEIYSIFFRLNFHVILTCKSLLSVGANWLCIQGVCVCFFVVIVFSVTTCFFRAKHKKKRSRWRKCLYSSEMPFSFFGLLLPVFFHSRRKNESSNLRAQKPTPDDNKRLVVVIFRVQGLVWSSAAPSCMFQGVIRSRTFFSHLVLYDHVLNSSFSWLSWLFSLVFLFFFKNIFLFNALRTGFSQSRDSAEI